MKVLLVDDDPQVLDAVGVALRFQWPEAQVWEARDGERALALFYQHEPDVVVLDVGMSGINGFEVLTRIRRVSDVPVVLLTARNDDADQMRGLGIGADEYVVKPFSVLVLLARIWAVVRRGEGRLPQHGAAVPTFGPLTIDFRRSRVWLNGDEVTLAPMEYRLLRHLARNAGRYLTREALLSLVWGRNRSVSGENLVSLVNRLRGKLEQPGCPALIENKRGLGYRLVNPEASPPVQA